MTRLPWQSDPEVSGFRAFPNGARHRNATPIQDEPYSLRGVSPPSGLSKSFKV